MDALFSQLFFQFRSKSETLYAISGGILLGDSIIKENLELINHVLTQDKQEIQQTLYIYL